MSASNLDLIALPGEIRLNVFKFLPPKDLCAAYRVCKLFRDDMTNSFFKEQCFAFFPALATIPRFYEPFVQTVENPWKWMCLSLSCKKIDAEKFAYIFADLAEPSSVKFESYLAEYMALNQSELEKDQASLKEISGVGDRDPNSKISKALKAFEESVNEMGTSDIFVDLQEAIINQTPSDFSEQLSLANEILAETEDKPISEIMFAIKDKITNPTIIQWSETGAKRIQAKRSCNQLFQKKAHLKDSVDTKTELLADIKKFKKSSTTIALLSDVVLTTLRLLPLLKQWMEYIPTIHKIEGELLQAKLAHHHQRLTPENIASLKHKINSLPKDIPELIWKQLYKHVIESEWAYSYAQNAVGEQGLRLSGEHLEALSIIFTVTIQEHLKASGAKPLLSIRNFNLNPIHEICKLIIGRGRENTRG